MRSLVRFGAVCVLGAGCHLIGGYDAAEFEPVASSAASGGGSTASTTSATGGQGGGGGQGTGGNAGGMGGGGAGPSDCGKDACLPNDSVCSAPEACIGGACVNGSCGAWGLALGDDDNIQSVRDLAVASDATIVMAGVFTGDITLGGVGYSGPMGDLVTDTFLVKYSRTGEHVWSQVYGDSVGATSTQLLSVDIGDDDSIVAGGSFTGTVDFGGGAIMAPTPSTGVVMKLQDDGSSAWARDLNTMRAVSAVVVGREGEVYVAASTSATSVSLGGGCPPTSAEGGSVVLARLSGASGACEWITAIGGTNTFNHLAHALAVDGQGDVVLSASIRGMFDIGNTSHNVGGQAAVIAKYSPGGMVEWSKTFGGDANQASLLDRVASIAVDGDDNLYLAGQFQGDTIDFGGSGGMLTRVGTTDGFVTSLTAEGNPRWTIGLVSENTADNGRALVRRVVFDRDRVLVFGDFDGEMINPGAGDLVNAGPPSSDAMLFTISPSGTPGAGRRYGDHRTQIGSALAVSPGGNIVVAGDYAGQLSFGPGAPLISNHPGDTTPGDIYLLSLGNDF